MAKGKIIPNGVELKPHEYSTVLFLTEQGYDIELIQKSNKEGVRTPDILMDGLRWEMKSPTGSGRWVINNKLLNAIGQYENVILDLRRIRLHHDKCKREIDRCFPLKKRIKRLKVITKSKRYLNSRRNKCRIMTERTGSAL